MSFRDRRAGLSELGPQVSSRARLHAALPAALWLGCLSIALLEGSECLRLGQSSLRGSYAGQPMLQAWAESSGAPDAFDAFDAPVAFAELSEQLQLDAAQVEGSIGSAFKTQSDLAIASASEGSEARSDSRLLKVSLVHAEPIEFEGSPFSSDENSANALDSSGAVAAFASR